MVKMFKSRTANDDMDALNRVLGINAESDRSSSSSSGSSNTFWLIAGAATLVGLGAAYWYSTSKVDGTDTKLIDEVETPGEVEDDVTYEPNDPNDPMWVELYKKLEYKTPLSDYETRIVSAIKLAAEKDETYSTQTKFEAGKKFTISQLKPQFDPLIKSEDYSKGFITPTWGESPPQIGDMYEVVSSEGLPTDKEMGLQVKQGTMMLESLEADSWAEKYTHLGEFITMPAGQWRILSVNGMDVSDEADFKAAKEHLIPGQEITFVVGQTFAFPRPSDFANQYHVNKIQGNTPDTEMTMKIKAMYAQAMALDSWWFVLGQGGLYQIKLAACIPLDREGTNLAYLNTKDRTSWTDDEWKKFADQFKATLAQYKAVMKQMFGKIVSTNPNLTVKQLVYFKITSDEILEMFEKNAIESVKNYDIWQNPSPEVVAQVLKGVEDLNKQRQSKKWTSGNK